MERQGRLWLGLNHKKYQDLCPQWVHPRIKLSVINKVWFNRCTGQVIRKAHKTRLCGRMEQGPSEGFIFQAALALKFIFRHTNVLRVTRIIVMASRAFFSEEQSYQFPNQFGWSCNQNVTLQKVTVNPHIPVNWDRQLWESWTLNSKWRVTRFFSPLSG